MKSEQILDPTCGGRSIWYKGNKDRDDTLYLDARSQTNPDKYETQYRGRTYAIDPDEIEDFRDLPYEDRSFNLIVWDPPHKILPNGNESLTGIIEKKYGALHAETWQHDLRKGFKELWRVLDEGGTLCFKFSDDAADFETVLDLFHRDPVFGTTTNQTRTDTRWFVFYKPEKGGG